MFHLISLKVPSSQTLFIQAILFFFFFFWRTGPQYYWSPAEAPTQVHSPWLAFSPHPHCKRMLVDQYSAATTTTSASLKPYSHIEPENMQIQFLYIVSRFGRHTGNTMYSANSINDNSTSTLSIYFKSMMQANVMLAVAFLVESKQLLLMCVPQGWDAIKSVIYDGY